jgi:RHS repeat-associated protein
VYNYVFNYTDHLGNVRVVYTKDPTDGLVKILEENNYYPYGLKHKNYNMDRRTYGRIQQGLMVEPVCSTCPVYYDYKYNGKELQEELGLNMYDYGARNYDPAIGRWSVIDPMAEMYHGLSGYNYVLNNPLSYIDPTGMAVEEVEGGVRFTEEDAKSAFMILSGKSKNAIVEVDKDKGDRDSMNASDKKPQNGAWQVFGVKSLHMANVAMGALGQLDNLIVSNHGAEGESTNYFALEDNIHMNSENSITTSEIASYNSKGGTNLSAGEQEVSIFKQLASRVKDNGNFILNFCRTGKGENGKTTLTELKTLLNDRVNIYLPTLDVTMPKFRYDTGVGINTNGTLNYDSNTKWIRSQPGVKNINTVNSIQMSKKADKPLIIK